MSDLVIVALIGLFGQMVTLFWMNRKQNVIKADVADVKKHTNHLAELAADKAGEAGLAQGRLEEVQRAAQEAVVVAKKAAQDVADALAVNPRGSDDPMDVRIIPDEPVPVTVVEPK